MAEYRLFTTWAIEAPIEDVYDAIRDSLNWPRWWRSVEQVIDLAPGDPSGIGRVQRYTWKGLLPYRLSFELRVTHVEAPTSVAGVVSGELEGVGGWRLSARGPVTLVRHDWQVRTTRPWMNRVAPLARPVFEWNHAAVMRQGARALAGRLGARLLVPRAQGAGPAGPDAQAAYAQKTSPQASGARRAAGSAPDRDRC